MGVVVDGSATSTALERITCRALEIQLALPVALVLQGETARPSSGLGVSTKRSRDI